ncbi:MAG: FAD:protein FMN transferase [Anaerobacillus sp.]
MMNQLAFACMGSNFFVEASNARELERWFQDVEDKYSRFRSDSEVSWLNGLEVSSEWIPISKEFYYILKEVEQFRQMTDSLFNPFLGDQLRALGYSRSFSNREIWTCEPNVRVVEETPILFHQGRPMIKKLKDSSVDLGGFVKGWSVDEAFNMASGEDLFIDGGGDMRFSFREPTMIGVMNPFHNETDIVQLIMREGAMATSSVLHRRWQTEHGEHHHILNGRTGRNPVSNVVQVTLFAPTVREAEVYAKVLCMMDVEEGVIWMKKQKESIGAIIISEDKTIHLTENIHHICEGVDTAWS